MSNPWVLSRYTSALPGRDGEVILVNSFMGAMCRIGTKHRDVVMAAVEHGLFRDQLPDELLFLGTNGYFVEDPVEEVAVVQQVLERERDRHGYELIIMPHENCNFRCTYCYESFARGKMTPDVVQGLKRLVDDQAEAWGRVHVSWFGGEPLLARDIIVDLSDSFMAACDRAGVRYGSAMTTNGYFLTPDVCRRLLDRKVHLFQVTVDGPAAEHNARRHLAGGGDTYQRVLDNLLAMREQPDEFAVRLRVNFDPDSAADIGRWLEDISPMFAGDERFNLAFHPIGRWGGPRDAENNVCDEDSAWRLRNTLVTRSLEVGFSAATYRGFLSSHGSTCYAGRKSSVVVGSDGRLYKCTVVFDDPRNHVGWLTSDGKLQFDHERWVRWVDTEHLETGKCNSCWFNGSCQSRSCPLVAMNTGSPPCPTHHDEMLEIVELAAYPDSPSTRRSATPDGNSGRAEKGRFHVVLT